MQELISCVKVFAGLCSSRVAQGGLREVRATEVRA